MPAAHGRRLRLLLVQDSQGAADETLLALRQGGIDPEWDQVETADALRAALAGGPWDAVVSDYTLSNFGAEAALVVVRSCDADLPFIIVSGTVGEDAAVAMMRATASDYILRHNLVRLAPTVEREVRVAGSRRATRDAERASARASAHLAAVVESSEEAILSQTLDGVITTWNQAAARLYGWTAAEAIGRHVSFLIPPDKTDELATHMARLRAGESVGYVETVRTHRSGESIDVAMSISRVRDVDGRLVGVSKTAWDIRARKRAEVALRESEARYRGLLESIPTLVWVYDADGRPLLHNRRWYEYTGQTVEETAAGRWHQAIHPDDAAAAVAEWTRCMATGEPYHIEYRLRRADGAYRWFLAQGTPHQESVDIDQWIGTCTDIDDVKRAAERLSSSESRYRRLFEAARDGILIVDPVSRMVIEANLFLAELIGYRREEVIGKELWEIGLLRDVAANREMFQTLQEKGYIRYDDLPLLAKSGRHIDVEFVSNIYEEAGDRVIQCNIRDITDQKQSVNKLRLFRALIDGTTDAIEVIDPETGRFLDMNETACAAHGYTREEYLSLNVSDLDAPAGPGPWAGFVEQRRLAEPRTIQSRHRRKDGTTFPVEVSLNPIRVDRDYMVAVVRDISEREQMEAAARTREAQLKLFIEHVSAPIAMLDRDMRYLHVSRRWLTDYDLGDQNLTGLSHYEVFPDAPQQWKDIHQRCLAGAVDRCEEARFERSNGTVQWIRWEIRPWTVADGEIGGIVMFTEDITQRKSAEEAIRVSETRYRTLIDATTAIVWDSPPSGAFDSNQPGWTAFTGQSVEEHRGWGWLDAVHPDDRAASGRAWAAATASRAVYEVEHRLRRADGEYRDMTVRAVPIIGPGGDVREWVGTHTDVTERKRAETAFRASEERFRAFMDHSPAATFIKTGGGQYLYVNEAWLRQFDPRPDCWEGKTDYDFWPRETADLFRASDLACQAAGGIVQAEESGQASDGREGTWLVMKFPLAEGGRLIGGMAWDISDRKRAEEALRMRDRAIQVATQGLVITDPSRQDNPVVYVSPGFERMTGYAAAEAIDRNCRFLQGKETDPATASRIRAAVRRGVAHTEEILNYCKDGTTFWNELSISPVRNGAGLLTHFVAVQSNVTARRELQEQFRQAQKMDAFGQLAGGVAHDFNNLLTIINGYSEMLLEDLPAADPSRELIAEIHKAGERSAGLTRQLLAFSRQQVLAPRLLSLNEVVTDTGSMLRRLIGEDVRLATVLSPGVWQVRADPGQVEQVLMNLAVNARDAMPTGGSLTIETRNIELDKSYCDTHPEARPGPHVQLSVTDTGDGMPPEVAARAFEPFYTTKGPGRGTGLGLATVHGIVRQSGGHVAVYSVVGGGTTFKVYLPEAELEPAGGSHTRPVAPDAPLGAETVLLVEDEASVRALVRRVLAGRGYTVIEAADGDEATRLAAEYGGPIDLLVTDVVMPGLGGRAVARLVAESYPRVRLLFISGYTDDAVIRHGVLTEGVNYLQKPFTPTALAHKVREVLDGRPLTLGD